MSKFPDVARDYQRGYLEQIRTNDGALPDTAQIEQIYRYALEKNEQPARAAIDGTMPGGVWSKFLKMDPSRVKQSHVFDDFSIFDNLFHWAKTAAHAFVRQQMKLLLKSIGINSYFTRALNNRYPRDPLALDLDGDGIETLGAADASAILFNHTGVQSRTIANAFDK